MRRATRSRDAARKRVQRRGSEVTAFSWGYEGWGNATRALVRAFAGAEQSAGYGPPMFVDLRARRTVRAEGFRERAFERLLGHSAYRWMRSLGNEAIVRGRGPMRLTCPAAVAQLLDLVIDMRDVRRRVIFFCHCREVQDCHRRMVAKALLRAARGRGVPLEICEWPGGQVGLKPVRIAAGKAGRSFVPVPGAIPARSAVRVPWGTVATLGLNGGSSVLIGPGIVHARKWVFPVLTKAPTAPQQRRAIQRFRKVNGLEAKTA